MEQNHVWDIRRMKIISAPIVTSSSYREMPGSCQTYTRPKSLHYSLEICESGCLIVVVQAEVVKDAGREESRYVVDCLLVSDQSLPLLHKSAAGLQRTSLVEQRG
jgi:hypothetical protein